MSQDYNNPAFKSLLQKLQEESWQLELLISGFAIFGLFTAYPYLETEMIKAQNTEQIYKFVVLFIGAISCTILIFNLLLHVLLRALWIGALGLRYVSGDIDYEELNYSEKFTKYLKKKVGSFDRYIAQLEDYCSIIFAISFLLIFYVLAITLFIITIALIATYVVSNDSLPINPRQIIGGSLIFFIVIGGFLTLVDFLTQGFLKRYRWLSKIYFPVYWVFSFLTLSFLYRPIVYNFLDNKFGRRLSLILVPLGIGIMVLLSLNFTPSNYFSVDTKSTSYMANSSNYEDLIDEDTEFIDDVAIQSKTITDNFIKVFVLYSSNIEDRIFGRDSTLRPENDKRGLKSNIEFRNVVIDGNQRDSLRRRYLRVFNEIYSIRIDSIKYPTDFIVSKSKNGNLGFETYIPTDSLSTGKHVIKYLRNGIKDRDTSYYTISTIPFWYFPDKK